MLGILIPGTPILMAVAAAAAMAGLSMTPILIVSIIGAVIGDFVSFYVGHRFSFRLRGVWPFATRPSCSRKPRGSSPATEPQAWQPAASSPCCAPRSRWSPAWPAWRARGSWSPMSVRHWSGRQLHVVPAQFAGLSLADLETGDWQNAAICAAALVVVSSCGWLLHRRLARAR